ncbi:uncharacterized protein mtSSB isoform X2 [Periplaneta americana]|uniref:uncharacterized protein mtSSB isoform X2 n=1 Tax=Periplaneta americana TaxID=6978 RepID=UPI0037E95F4A
MLKKKKKGRKSKPLRNALATVKNPSPSVNSLNEVTLLGRVGGEPQKRGTEEHPVVIFSLATHTNYKYDTVYHNVDPCPHHMCVKNCLMEYVNTYSHGLKTEKSRKLETVYSLLVQNCRFLLVVLTNQMPSEKKYSPVLTISYVKLSKVKYV